MERPDGSVRRRTYWPLELVGWLMVVCCPGWRRVVSLPYIGRPSGNLTRSVRFCTATLERGRPVRPPSTPGERASAQHRSHGADRRAGDRAPYLRSEAAAGPRPPARL